MISIHQINPKLPQINCRPPKHYHMPPEPLKNQYTTISTHLSSMPPSALQIYRAIMAPLLTQHSYNSALQGTTTSMLFDAPVGNISWLMFKICPSWMSTWFNQMFHPFKQYKICISLVWCLPDALFT